MLTVKQVAERLTVSVSKVYQLVERGELGHHRVGAAIRMTEEQIAEYLETVLHHPQSARQRTTKRPPFKHLRLKNT